VARAPVACELGERDPGGHGERYQQSSRQAPGVRGVVWMGHAEFPCPRQNSEQEFDGQRQDPVEDPYPAREQEACWNLVAEANQQQQPAEQKLRRDQEPEQSAQEPIQERLAATLVSDSGSLRGAGFVDGIFAVDGQGPHRCWAARLSLSMAPVSRAPPQMSDGHDEDLVRLDTIQKTVWKPGDQYSAEPAAKRVATLREGHQPLIRPLDCGDEIDAEVPRLALVVLGCREKLCLGLGVKSDRPQRRNERAFSMTRSAGTGVTAPDSISSSRRSASRIQISSESASASGSRLEMSRSASRARCSGGSSSALASSLLAGSTIWPG